MPLYRYRAVDADGVETTGTMDEASARRVTANLEEKGLQVSSVEEVRPAQRIARRSQLTWEELEQLNSQLLWMAQSGLPLAPSLEAVGRELGGNRLARVMTEIQGDLERGLALYEALERHASAVSPVYVAAVRAGEKTGNLAAVLEQYAGYAAQMVALKSRMREAFAYPVVVLCATAGVIVLLFGRIVPEFAAVFKDFGAQLPAITRFWIGVSDVIRRDYGAISLIICLLLIAGIILSRTKPGRYATDWLKLHVWGVRGGFGAASMARFCRSMGVLLAGHAPMNESIELAARTCGNSVLEAAALDAANQVRQGTRLALAFELTGYYSGLFCWLVDLGDQRGDVPGAMFDLAKTHETQFMQSSRVAISVLGPLLLVILGLVVSSVIFALYLPIFSLADAISGS